MSLDINVYVEQISDDIIPKVVKRLNEFEMDCELHPNFSFSNSSGFQPFKYKLTNPKFQILRDKVLISGFEFYLDDFNLEKEKSNNKVQVKQGFFNKLFGKKLTRVEDYFQSQEIDAKLKDCKKMLSFTWHSMDSFELRFAHLTSAIISELTNGVRCYPPDNIWYDNETVIADAWKEVQEFEQSLQEQDLKFHPYDQTW